MLYACAVYDVKAEFGAPRVPSCELSGGIRRIEDPSEGFVVGAYRKSISFLIRAEEK